MACSAGVRPAPSMRPPGSASNPWAARWPASPCRWRGPHWPHPARPAGAVRCRRWPCCWSRAQAPQPSCARRPGAAGRPTRSRPWASSAGCRCPMAAAWCSTPAAPSTCATARPSACWSWCVAKSSCRPRRTACTVPSSCRPPWAPFRPWARASRCASASPALKWACCKAPCNCGPRMPRMPRSASMRESRARSRPSRPCTPARWTRRPAPGPKACWWPRACGWRISWPSWAATGAGAWAATRPWPACTSPAPIRWPTPTACWPR